MLSCKSEIPNFNIHSTVRPKQLTNYAFLQVQLNSVPDTTDAKAEKQIQSTSSEKTVELSAPQQARQHWERQEAKENSVLAGVFTGQEQGTA